MTVQNIYRETIEKGRDTFILEAYYILSVCSVHSQLASSTKYKNYFIIDPVLLLYT